MIILNQEGPIATITINRPEVSNVLNKQLLLKLTEAIRELSANKNIRILIITGAGDRAFVGGADLHIFKEMDPDAAEQYIIDVHQCLLAIRQSEKIVIASINGYALGGGTEMIASCDLRIASEKARFGMPEVKVGVPSVIEAAYLPRFIGLGRAAYLIYTGEMIDAREAERIGLIDKVVPHERLKEETQGLAEKVLANGPTAILLQKKLLAKWMDLNLSDSIEEGIAVFRECSKSGEHKEAARAFLEKRKPSFGTKLGG